MLCTAQRKKLYGQFGWNEGVTARYYRGLIIEQDKDSAHCYFREDYDYTDEVIADIGAAEGIFGLDVVENAKNYTCLNVIRIGYGR